jgi:hypothetical protein
MSTDVLRWLRQRGVHLEHAGDKVRFLPRDLPAEDADLIRTYKITLLSALAEEVDRHPSIDAVIALWANVGSPFLKNPGPPPLTLGQGDEDDWRAHLEAEERLGDAGVEVIYTALQRRAAVYSPDISDCLLCGGGGVRSPFATQESLCAHCARLEAAVATTLREASCTFCQQGGVLIGIRASDGGMIHACAVCQRDQPTDGRSTRRRR